ncbi:MAG: PA0069 family radical SAM protein [Planctomycetota bacterium]|nr:MAG: PA0069 family radical SAM protein [Planctomycetota bacterium]
MSTPPGPRGRGAAANPENRFEALGYTRYPEADLEEEIAPQTQLLRDHSRSIIAYNDSPDIGFAASINPYRGCEHGCVYCYARPTHEYLGFSAGLDFESRILVKEDAPELLRAELSAPRWRPQLVALSGVTDPYQPAERRLRLTRRCLEVLAEFRNPAGVVTKSHLVTRDADVLGELARHHAASVFLSVTTLDEALSGTLEPRAARPQRRLDAIARLSQAGIPTGVLVAPVIPGLTEHELPAILQAAARAGARSAGYVVLRLPFGLKDIFLEWLERHRPGSKDKVVRRIESLRDGRLNDTAFGRRQRGTGPYAERIRSLFQLGCARAGLSAQPPPVSAAAFRRPGAAQALLF